MWKNLKIGDLSDLEREQIVYARLAGESVTKTATLLGRRERQFLRLCRHTWITGRQHQWGMNIGQKSTLTKKYRCTLRIVLKNHSTAAQVTSLNIHPEVRFYTNLSNMSFRNPTSIMVGLQLLNLWLLKENLRRVNNGVMTIKPGHKTTGKVWGIWSDESSFMLFPTSVRAYSWRSPK
jgi:hypothetical protein